MNNDQRNIETTRTKALEWWNKMNLESKFYIIIEYNDLISGDRTRHPDTLTGREIETIWSCVIIKSQL